MAARPTTPKPARRKGNRGRPPKRPPSTAPAPAPLTSSEALRVLADRVRSAEDGADRAGTATTALAVHYAAGRFLRWTDAFGIDLNALSATDTDRWRHLPPGVAVAYATQLARPGSIGCGWFLDTLSQLRTAFERSNIAVAGFTDSSTPEVAAVIQGLAAQLEPGDRRPAVPVLAHHLTEINDAIAELDANPVWVAALRAWQTLSWTYGGRAVETTTRLRWSDFALDDDQDRLRWPAGCKYQSNDITLTRTRSDELPVAADVRRQLEGLRGALREAGHDPTPADFIFPLIDAATGALIIDPVGSLLDDSSFRPDLDGLARRGRAERSVTQRYRKAWTEAALTTSINQNLGHRRVTPHGLRRALATVLAALGRSDIRIQHEMRHGRLATTLLYVDGRSLPVTDAYALLDDLDAGRPTTDPHGLLAGALALTREHVNEDDGDDCGSDTVGPLPVLGWEDGCSVDGCWKRHPGDLWSDNVGGHWMVICTGHLQRFSRNEPDWQAPLEICDGSRTTYPCKIGPLAAVTDGDVTMRLCPSCHGRYRKALASGDTSNWQQRRHQRIIPGTPCEADCDAVHGPGLGFQRLTVGDRTWILCGAHAARARNGAKPGWTSPIQRQRTKRSESDGAERSPG